MPLLQKVMPMESEWDGLYGRQNPVLNNVRKGEEGKSLQDYGKGETYFPFLFQIE